MFWSLDSTVLKSEADGIVGRLGAAPTEQTPASEIGIAVSRGSLSVAGVLPDYSNRKK